LLFGDNDTNIFKEFKFRILSEGCEYFWSGILRFYSLSIDVQRITT